MSFISTPVYIPECSTITNSFSDVHKPTIGVDFHFRKFEVNGVSVALQLWDIAGMCSCVVHDAFAIGVRSVPDNPISSTAVLVVLGQTRGSRSLA